MKKMMLLGVVFALFTVAASAQKGKTDRSFDRDHKRFETGALTRGEKGKIARNRMDYKKAERHFKRDGHFSRKERQKLSHMRKHNRHDAFRFKHNKRRYQ